MSFNLFSSIYLKDSLSGSHKQLDESSSGITPTLVDKTGILQYKASNNILGDPSLSEGINMALASVSYTHLRAHET